MIKITNISKHYEMGDTSIKAIDDISLNINDGEFISIVGKSGSGKSTLLHLIGTLDKVTSGNIEFNNKDISKLSNDELAIFRNKKIGFIFQSYNLENSFTALQNVELPLIVAGIDHKQRKEIAKNALIAVGLENRIQHRISQLSGGERQRVCIARAIVNNPECILADEPTGNLDTVTGNEIMNLLISINKKEKRTLILVTHNLDDAKKAQRIIRLIDGKVVDDNEVN